MSTARPNRQQDHDLDIWDACLALLCSGCSLGLYLRTLVPGLLPGDSGEFQTLAYLLGHTHPTGYPVYLVLARLAAWLPVGGIAYRVNLFSAIMGAITAAGLYLSGRCLVSYRLPALAGALILAASPTFWSQAVIAEVYTSGAAFLVAILFLLLRWDRTRDGISLLIAGLVGGLSLGVHFSVLLLAPAVLVYLCFPGEGKTGAWKWAVGGAGLGLLITLMLFLWMDGRDPPANYFNSVIFPSRSAWGLTPEQIDSPLERLLFGWSARQFRPYLFSGITNIMPAQAQAYWKALPAEVGLALIGLAAVGLLELLLRRFREGILLALSLALQLAFPFNYQIWDLYVFFIPSYILISLLAVAGMGALIDLIQRGMPKNAPGRSALAFRLISTGLITSLAVGLSIQPILGPALQAVKTGQVPFHFEEYPEYNELSLDLARAVVDKLPERAIVFTDWSMMWPYYYAAQIAEDRPDLVFIETYPADNIPGLADSLLDYVAVRVKNQPVFFSERDQDLIQAGFKLIPTKAGPVRLLRVKADD
jgi:hypothetical protein